MSYWKLLTNMPDRRNEPSWTIVSATLESLLPFIIQCGMVRLKVSLMPGERFAFLYPTRKMLGVIKIEPCCLDRLGTRCHWVHTTSEDFSYQGAHPEPSLLGIQPDVSTETHCLTTGQFTSAFTEINSSPLQWIRGTRLTRSSGAVYANLLFS